MITLYRRTVFRPNRRGVIYIPPGLYLIPQPKQARKRTKS